MAITIKTNLMPAITFDPFLKKKEPAAPSTPILKILRPTIEYDLPVVGKGRYAPWGNAVEGLGGLLVYGVLAMAVFGALSLFQTLRKIF